MADVRLTATNPEDSSVVPVACNEKGELKLEEPLVVEGPPGEPGEKGDPGDPFSGNFAGDVTFGGSAEFAGEVAVEGRVSSKIDLLAANNTGTGGLIISTSDDGTRNAISSINRSVSGLAIVNDTGGSLSGAQQDITLAMGSTNPVITFVPGGGATFANGNAGFTKEGHLWCTTSRGDTVMLTATVGGAGMWEDYTPSTRRDEIKDAWAEKNVLRPKPEDSSQDEPETKQ